tara:strand:+ start:1294 stop:1767 length:474 start_codon:yes stop_codon:yes gene_type:complete
MEILFHDYYSSCDNIDNLNNYYNNIYQYYKKKKDISMYLLKNNFDIIGILIYENINKLCKIYVIDICFKDKNISLEFIYFIGDYLVNNFNKLIFCNINNNILKNLYNLVFKYKQFKIYNLDSEEITHSFENININDIFIFKKYIEEEYRNTCCTLLI